MRAAIYTRVSTSMQVDDGFSLEARQDVLLQTIERKGLQLYRVYSDPGISGKTFKRPGVQAMIADMKAGRFKRSLEYPYSGIIKCGQCGATYAGNARL